MKKIKNTNASKYSINNLNKNKMNSKEERKFELTLGSYLSDGKVECVIGTFKTSNLNRFSLAMYKIGDNKSIIHEECIPEKGTIIDSNLEDYFQCVEIKKINSNINLNK